VIPGGVVLWNPRSSRGRKPIVPLALLAVAAGIDWPWQVVDSNLVGDPEPALAAALDAIAGRRVLAVTVMPGPQLAEALPVCRAIKARFPEVVVVWGGYFPTQHWEVVARTAECVDWVARGHADRTFPALLRLLAEGGDPAAIPGLAWRAGGAVRTSGRAEVPSPRDLPPLPLDAVDLTLYVRKTVLGKRTLGYHSSYGCPFTCNFCAVVTMDSAKWKAQPADQVGAVLRAWKARYDIDAIEFYDNNFFVSEARVAAFARSIEDLGVHWWGEGRVDTILKWSDETLALAARSGLQMIFLGAESGSAETLARMDKGGTLTPDDTLALVARLGRFGIVPECSFVLGNPPDPEADLEQTLAFVRQVKAANPLTEIILYLYSPEPVPGELLAAAESTGFRYPDSVDAWVSPRWRDFAQRRTAHGWLRPSLRTRLKEFERVLNAYHPTSTDPRLKGPMRWVLRGMSAWRWHSGTYRLPVELAVAQRVFRYQRPETSGF
jgi:hypothetical protein